MSKSLFIIALILLSFDRPVNAYGPEHQPSDTTETAYTGRLTVLPVLGSSPETSLMFGGVAMQQFKPFGAGPETRPSHVIFSAIYTLNNQVLIELLPAIILPEERWILGSSAFAYYFPDSYWGIGPETENDDEVRIEYKMFNLRFMGHRKLSRSFYAGPILRWYKNYDFIFEDSDGEEFEPVNLTGSEGGSAFGIGGALRLDRRNSIMTPTENYFLEFTATFYPEIFGTTFSYSQFRLDGRKYFDLEGDQSSVLAFHTRVQSTAGDTPFLDLADLGGREIMRGYYQGRFRDNHSLQLQAEWRRHLIGRFGFTLFGGAGDVFPDWGSFGSSGIKWAGGAGLRFNLNPGDTTNLRLDFAAGPKTSGLYFTLGEAF